MRKKIKIDIGRLAFGIVLVAISFCANANFLRAEGGGGLIENNGRVSGNRSMASYTAPANVVLTNSGQNATSGFVTRYILVNNVTQSIAYSNTTPVFSNVPVGNYSAYAVNYNSAQTAPTLSVGTALAAIGGECVSTSSSFEVIVTSGGVVACLPATAGVGTISASAVGNNTSAGFLTRYVLTNSTGTIVSSNTTGSFPTPTSAGEVRIYAVNYSTSGTQPTFTNGGNISSIGGECVDVSDTPKCFDVTVGNIACSPVSGGATLTAVASGNNTSAGFVTRYVFTNASGVILNSNTTGIFTAPNTAGEVRIYSVNYSTSGVQPIFTNGNNVSSVTGDCVDVSDIPKCFNVTPVSTVCTNVSGGATISATASGNNTGNGFVTRYVLTNATGVILNSNTSGSFTAPNVAGEVRIYAVNYSSSGVQPVFTNGINISSTGGDCVDVSSVPKCFTVTPVTVTCTIVAGGSPISAIASGHNTGAGFATSYVLTNAAGVIQSSNTTGQFTAPSTPGQEYRIYAVNYATSGVQPTLTSGTNISVVGGDCVDVSDIPKCFAVQSCPNPENNCLRVTARKLR